MNVRELIFHTLADCGCIVDYNVESDIVTVIDDNKVTWNFTVPKIAPIQLIEKEKENG